ncbi:MAG: hypothetical protein PVS2B2_03220 [Candidatus Acidiferrum sp.]
MCSLALGMLIGLTFNQPCEGYESTTFSFGSTLPSASTTSTYLLQASTNSLAFGNVLVDKSAYHSLTLTNSGNSAVRISQISTPGTAYKASGLLLPFTLAAGQHVGLGITFTPTTTGSFTGYIEVFSNATNSPAKIYVFGTGVQPKIAVVPSSINFGSVPLGVTNTQTLTVSNPGSATLSVSQVSAKGSGYSVSGLTLPLNIAPKSSAAFTVRFSPAIVGATNGSLSLISNALGSLTSVALSGNGVLATLHLSANPTSLGFGTLNLGSNATKTVTLSNTGNSKVSVSGIKVSGAGFSVSVVAVPFTLGAGQSAGFTVEFAPTIAANSTGSISVSSTASNSPDTISLAGSGVQSTSHSVVLTWGASSSNVAGYHLYRSNQTTGTFTRLNSTVIVGTTYTDTTIQTDQSYFYAATAVALDGAESSFSNEISIVVP